VDPRAREDALEIRALRNLAPQKVHFFVVISPMENQGHIFLDMENNENIMYPSSK